MDPFFIGEIRIFAGNFAPRGWAFCDGQLLPISQNDALFSILGTIYGGDGRTTFALPDLRGRVPFSAGHGPGLRNYAEGQKGGTEYNILTSAQLPAHTHQLKANNTAGNSSDPTGNVLANTVGLDREYSSNAPDVNMHPNALHPEGGSQAVENRQPFLAIRYIIALQGTYPSRS